MFSLCICWSSFLWKCTMLLRVEVTLKGPPPHPPTIFLFFLVFLFGFIFWCKTLSQPLATDILHKNNSLDYPSVSPVTLSRAIKGKCGTEQGPPARSIGSTANTQVVFQALEWCLWPPETEISLSYFWSFSSKSGVGVSGSLVQGHTPGCDLICVHMSFEKGGQLPFYPFNHCLRM